MNEIWRYDLRCCECGRFVKPNADSSTPYGGYLDIEPPEDEFYCSKCVETLTKQYIEQGWVPVAYRPAKWHEAVKKILDQRKLVSTEVARDEPKRVRQVDC